jgi:hypothetical protein
MFAINSVSDIAAIEERGGVALTLLASPVEISTLRWLVDAWLPIHFESDCRWHLIIPTNRSFDHGNPLSALSDYNGSLARDLLRLYGLQTSEMPCLVIDNFNEEEQQLCIGLPRASDERDQLLVEIAAYFQNNAPEDRPAFGRQRQALGEALHRHLAQRRLKRTALKTTLVIGGALAKRFLGHPS